MEKGELEKVRTNINLKRNARIDLRFYISIYLCNAAFYLIPYLFRIRLIL